MPPPNSFFPTDAQNLDRALAHHRAGRLAEAEAIYRTILAARPDHPDALHMLGLLAFQCGQAEAAVELIGRAVEIKSGDPFSWNNLGAACRAMGKLDVAGDCFRRAAQLKPDYAEAHGNLGGVLKATGYAEEAAACYRRALKLDPRNSALLNNLGNALGELGRADEAADCYRQAIAANPGNAEAHNNLGVALAARGDKEAAAASYRRAIAARPDYADAHLNLGNALKDLGRLEEAAACYREVVRLDPANGIAPHLLAALTGGEAERAPDAYVAGVFDHYADDFDAHLTGNLGYRVPERLVAALERHGRPAGARKWDVLDLGCGTGLAGAAIAPLAATLVGVDLSSKMLDKARQRGLYARLAQADLLTAMAGEAAASYDVILAADVFVYLGRLDDVVAESARLLRPGGLFAFSVEAIEALPAASQGGPRDFVLNDKGRFAHAAAYIERLAADHALRLLELTALETRLEGGKPVQGWLAVLGR